MSTVQATGLHPNALRMIQVMHDFSSGDHEAPRRMFAADCVWHAAGDNPFSGDRVGRQAVGDWFVEVAAIADEGTMTTEPIDVLADDTHVVFLHRLRARRGDRYLDQTHMNAWRFEDGLCVEGWFLPDSTADWDAFAR